MNSENVELEWLFRIFNRMRHNKIRKEFKNRGVSKVSHPHILFILRYESEEKGLYQKDLCNKLGISPSTVAISLQRMEKVGLVKKEVDAGDQRRNLVTITEKGKEFIDKCKNEIDKIDQKLLEGFSQEEKNDLKNFYIRMIKNLGKAGESLPEVLEDIAID